MTALNDKECYLVNTAALKAVFKVDNPITQFAAAEETRRFLFWTYTHREYGYRPTGEFECSLRMDFGKDSFHNAHYRTRRDRDDDHARLALEIQA